MCFIHFISITTEIRDFERSEEIPLQLMVMYFVFKFDLTLSSVNTTCITIKFSFLDEQQG